MLSRILLSIALLSTIIMASFNNANAIDLITAEYYNLPPGVVDLEEPKPKCHAFGLWKESEGMCYIIYFHNPLKPRESYTEIPVPSITSPLECNARLSEQLKELCGYY